ncbi:MAG: sigma-70 family RNA polymerase sigma factor [Oscillospiraceae bacterium]|nr:sigma-70 family RNA polymerase sigma factor [Oscillospiraceae bacterium]
MLLNYTYQNIQYSISVNWNGPDGKSSIHTAVVEQLSALHGRAFMVYWNSAQLLDERVDKLYNCIYLFNSEHYAAPYNPKNRDYFLMAFSDYCSCLEAGIASDPSPQAQVLLHIFQTIQNILQETVGIYLVDHAYQNKHFKHSRRKETRLEVIKEPEPSYEFETALLQMLDLSRMLEQLNELQRRRVVKRFVLGQTYQEIADEEGVSVQAVRYSILSALKKLKTLL